MATTSSSPHEPSRGIGSLKVHLLVMTAVFCGMLYVPVSSMVERYRAEAKANQMEKERRADYSYAQRSE